jgi:penicillin V acylase-like amidase (Ntn superfamily)
LVPAYDREFRLKRLFNALVSARFENRPSIPACTGLSMKRLFPILAVALASVLGATSTFACTTFVLQGKARIYFGRNLDWTWEDGLVVVNPRNVQKLSMVMPPHVPVKWTSKYGSVTFNQFGQEMPFGGMNEAGLVVEQMMLDESQYAPPDARPELNMLQWIQYQLDNCRTVDEVLATDEKIRVEQPTVPARIHYLICDAKGDCATIEFLGGKRVCHRGKDLPFQALANDTYENSLAYSRAHPEPEPTPAKAENQGSLARFAHAATRASRFKADSPERDLTYAFDTLEQVCQGKFTVWRIVYDVPGRRILYRTRNNTKERSLDLKALNFSCARPLQFASIEAGANDSGKLAFQDLTEAKHRTYLESFLHQESLRRDFGDLTPLMEGLLLTLRSYNCLDK